MNEMRIPAASKVKEANTPAESLRQQLKRLESLLGKLTSDTDTTEAIEILRCFDQIDALMSQLEKTDMDLAAERTRLETVQKQTKRKAKLFMKTVGGEEKLQALRVRHKPAPSQWWWFLDEYLQEQRHQRRQQRLRTLGIGAAILAVLVLLYNLLLAPDPETRKRYQLEQEAERAIAQGDATTALAKVNEALDLGQSTADLLILKGVVLQASGKPAEAENAFTEAQMVLEDREAFYLSRARTYLRIGNQESSLSDAQNALERNPDSAYGYYLAGTALIGLNRFAEAEERLEKASELAEAQNNAQLQGMARVQIANISMMIEAPPTQSRTPDSG